MMDFDHRDPSTKLFALAGAHAVVMSRDKLIAEVEKCGVVCANCHALRTFGALLDRRRRSTPEEWTPGTSAYIERKRLHWRASAALLDALCPATKKFVISRSRTRAHATLLAEVAKCDIVCTNCHRDRTYRRRVAA
jgi:hypothetical protein